jgi:hypothetical protein
MQRAHEEWWWSGGEAWGDGRTRVASKIASELNDAVNVFVQIGERAWREKCGWSVRTMEEDLVRVRIAVLF